MTGRPMHPAATVSSRDWRLAPGVGTIHRYHRLYHELFNEADAANVFADVRNWLPTLHDAPAADKLVAS